MTSSKQRLRHPSTQTPDPSSPTFDLRTSNLLLRVAGNPEELHPFLELSSKVASCFKPALNVVVSGSSQSAFCPRTSSSSSSSSASTLSSSSTLLQSANSSSSSLSSSLSSSSSSSSSTLPSTSTHPQPSSTHPEINRSRHNEHLESEISYFENSDTTTPSQRFHPSLSVVVFLRHLDADPGEKLKPNATPRDRRASTLERVFKSVPWKLHHKESVKKVKVKGNTNTLVTEISELYYLSRDLPLCGLRQVHHGCEHVRVVLNISCARWEDQVQFYSLILGLSYDFLSDDFCLFTVQKDPNLDYDVQLGLKRLSERVSHQTLDNVHLQIKVKDLGKLVALFPNVCEPISDVLWRTTDHDGNGIILHVIRTRHEKSRRAHQQLQRSLDDVAVYECMTSPTQQQLHTVPTVTQSTQTCSQSDNEFLDEQDVSRSNDTSSSSIKNTNDPVYENFCDANIYVNCDTLVCNNNNGNNKKKNKKNDNLNDSKTNNNNNKNNNSNHLQTKKAGDEFVLNSELLDSIIKTTKRLCDDRKSSSGNSSNGSGGGRSNSERDSIQSESRDIISNGLVFSDEEIPVFCFPGNERERGTSGVKPVQEDEESLTLTNLSEESGIIVFHDDVGDGAWGDGAWGDGDGEGEGQHEIRPCLRKHVTTSTSSSTPPARCNNSNTIRNRRVRFSDEIKAQQIVEDCQSRLSSGFESDEPSDVEPDTTSSRTVPDTDTNHPAGKSWPRVAQQSSSQLHHRHRKATSSCSSSETEHPSMDSNFTKHYQNEDHNSLSPTNTNNSFLKKKKNNLKHSKSDSGDKNTSMSYAKRDCTGRLRDSEAEIYSTIITKTESECCSSRSTPRNKEVCRTRTRSVDRSNHQSGPVSHALALNSSSSPSSPSSSSTPASTFRPICPPSYEVALAMKWKAQENVAKATTTTTTAVTAVSRRHSSVHGLNKSTISTTKSPGQRPGSMNGGAFPSSVLSSHATHTSRPARIVDRDDNDNEKAEEDDEVEDEQNDDDQCETLTLSLKNKGRRTSIIVFNDSNNNNSSKSDNSNCMFQTPKKSKRRSIVVAQNPNSKTQNLNQTDADNKNSFLPETTSHLLSRDMERDLDKKDEKGSPADITTTFTLRFDTCPMSGGQPREEQTGFYV